MSYRRSSDGVAIKGIDLAAESAVTDIQSLVRPRDRLTSIRMRTACPGSILGGHVAENLNASVGMQVQLLSPGPAASLRSDTCRGCGAFKVVGTFHSGMYEILTPPWRS
ncbi:MAG: hypothetical protein R3E12_10330 [Candidatus Eisenbacteria bacterium]